MCEWGRTVECVVLIPAHLSHTAQERFASVQVDACLADLVDAMNAAGIYTTSSCCGHGKCDGSILLADGRELVIKTAAHPPQGKDHPCPKP